MVLVRYTNMLWRTQSLVISVCLFSWTEVVLLLGPRSFPFFFSAVAVILIFGDSGCSS